MNNPIVYALAVNCTVSPLNVRKSSNADADAELAANVGETGIVLQNLIGVAVKRKKDHYSIIGGGRRLRAVLDQIETGKLPRDFQVPVMVMPNANDAIQMSLSENYYNLAMNPADACEAFRNMIDKEGKTVEQVAKRLGLSKRFVEGRLRLAHLAEPIFEALRSEEITLDVAMAYGSTSDTARQATVFEQMAGNYYRDNVNEIRRMLAAGSYKGSDPKVIFVGREAYQAAGGRIDSDLFSSAETESWIDADIVDRLAEEKLAEAALALRDREGFAEVRAIPALKVPYMETCDLDRVDGDPVPLTAEAEARKLEIEAEIAAIDEAAEDAGDYSEEQSERYEVLQDELDALTDTGTLLTNEQKASAIAYVVIGADGQPALHQQLYAEPAVEAANLDNGDDDEAAPAEDAEANADDDVDGEGIRYSLRLMDELAMMKTELLTVHIASDPHFALDLGTFIMADNAMRTLSYYGMPSELRANAPSPRVSGFESGSAAAEAWSKLDAELDRSWANHKDIEVRYDAFCALDESSRAAWLGWAIARTLHAVPAGATGGSFLNHLGAKLKIDVAAWWRPTARNFFDRITKPGILSLFEAIGGSELKSRYAASRKFDLAASAEKFFAGEVIVETDVKERALAWLPGPMRFEAEDDAVDIESVEADPVRNGGQAQPDDEGGLQKAA